MVSTSLVLVTRHTGSVLCLDMYGKYCVSGSRDNEVKGKETTCSIAKCEF